MLPAANAARTSEGRMELTLTRVVPLPLLVPTMFPLPVTSVLPLLLLITLLLLL